MKLIGYFKLEGWTSKLPFYSWFCKICKQDVINYPSSHYEILKCPSCLHLREMKIMYDKH